MCSPGRTRGCAPTLFKIRSVPNWGISRLFHFVKLPPAPLEMTAFFSTRSVCLCATLPFSTRYDAALAKRRC